jgi:hypothetical protein
MRQFADVSPHVPTEASLPTEVPCTDQHSHDKSPFRWICSLWRMEMFAATVGDCIAGWSRQLSLPPSGLIIITTTTDRGQSGGFCLGWGESGKLRADIGLPTGPSDGADLLRHSLTLWPLLGVPVTGYVGVVTGTADRYPPSLGSLQATSISYETIGPGTQ